MLIAMHFSKWPRIRVRLYPYTDGISMAGLSAAANGILMTFATRSTKRLSPYSVACSAFIPSFVIIKGNAEL